MSSLNILKIGIGFVAASASFVVMAGEKIKVEIPVQAALAPKVGFDDNDTIEVVLHGNLPNSCYSVGDYEVVKDDTTQTVRVKQFAFKNLEGVCAEGAELPVHMKMQIPFTNPVTIGHLPVGNYSIEFSELGGQVGMRSLAVEAAPALTVDTKPYAIISNIESSDFFGANDSVKVKVRGMVNSTCVKLDENPQVVQQGDVVIVLPTVHVTPNMMCAEMLVPIEKEFDFGKNEVGHHLIHVRSMNGRSMNRVVEVTALK